MLDGLPDHSLVFVESFRMRRVPDRIAEVATVLNKIEALQQNAAAIR